MAVKKVKPKPRRPNVEPSLRALNLFPDTKIFKRFEHSSPLRGPYSGTIYGGVKNPLTPKNAKGWVSPSERGQLIMCERGYHAFLGYYAPTWCSPDSLVYQIKPIGKVYGASTNSKVIMRRFKILCRLTKKQVANLLLYGTTTKPRGSR